MHTADNIPYNSFPFFYICYMFIHTSSLYVFRQGLNPQTFLGARYKKLEVLKEDSFIRNKSDNISKFGG